MRDPLSYLALALAAGDGTLDGIPVRRLVAAGHSLLRRCAPLVRAVQGRRSALLVPPGAPLVVALAASEGRGALLMGATTSREAVAAQLASANVGAAFTLRSLEDRLPDGFPRVLLDDAPLRASWHAAGETRLVDLATHEALHVEYDGDAEGSDDEVLCLSLGPAGGDTALASLSHRRVLASARAFAREAMLAARDHTLVVHPGGGVSAVLQGVVAPLLAGGRVSSMTEGAADRVVARLESEGVSMLVAAPRDFSAILDLLTERGQTLDAPVLQRCVAVGVGVAVEIDAKGQAPGTSLGERWYEATGVRLTPGEARSD